MPALQISRKMDYALRALAYLADHHGEHGCTVGDIANHTDVSSHFLTKIIAQLAHSGLVRSRRGPGGGCVLARQPSEVSVKDVLEALEGPITLNTCVGPDGDCRQLQGCRINSMWQQAEQRLLEVLGQTTLADLRRGPRAGGNGSLLGDPNMPIVMDAHPRQRAESLGESC